LDPLRELKRFDATGKWIAQRKFNGIRTLLWVGPNAEVKLYDRYLKPHNYSLTSHQTSLILSNLNVEQGKEYWFDGEHLHAKTRSIKDTLVFFDVLWAGRFLYGMTQIDRLSLLNSLCGNPTLLEPGHRAIRVCDGLWLAEVFSTNFMAHYKESLTEDWCEGLVLRQKLAKLDSPCRKVNEEVRWQKRCRKPAKSYTH
tara:strand:- start:1783 stop:2376 length:594 start_codon:yes stop_codon:yes gene_type:complete